MVSFILRFLFSGVRHEYISGYYRVSVYFLAKILSDITLRTITSVIFSCIVYFMIGKTSKLNGFSLSLLDLVKTILIAVFVHSGLKPTASAFLIFTLTVTLVAYTATAMTMAISADQAVVALANIFMTITFVFMMVRAEATQNNTSQTCHMLANGSKCLRFTNSRLNRVSAPVDQIQFIFKMIYIL